MMTKLIIEIADTPMSLAKGLMGRTELPKNHGMLFKFPMVLEARFWGKDTYIPLDIAFINKEGTITEIGSITPLSTKLVSSSLPCSMAIEANQGFFKKNEISLGCKIEVLRDQDGKEKEIIFVK